MVCLGDGLSIALSGLRVADGAPPEGLRAEGGVRPGRASQGVEMAGSEGFLTSSCVQSLRSPTLSDSALCPPLSSFPSAPLQPLQHRWIRSFHRRRT